MANEMYLLSEESARKLAALLKVIGGTQIPGGAVTPDGMVFPVPAASARGGGSGRGWPGKVVAAGPAGEADFPDHRYWVEWTGCTNHDEDAATAAAVLEALDAEHDLAGIEAVTNLAEAVNGTHGLPVDTPVWVWVLQDQSDPPRPRRVMAAGAGVSVKWGFLTAAWVSGNTVTLTPCVGQTDATPAGAANVTCTLQSPSGAAPSAVYLAANDIIAYLPTGTNTGIALPVRFRRALLVRGTATRNASGTAGKMAATATTCNWTYDIRDLDGNLLAEGQTPERPRIPNCEYTGTSPSPALIYQDAAGAWRLADVLTERPATKTLTSITSWQVDGATLKLQYKTTAALVLDNATESGWIDAHTGSNQCPPP